MRWVAWTMIGAGLCCGAAGYLLRNSADKTGAEAAVYHRELSTTVDAVTADTRVARALSKSAAWVEETTKCVISNTGIKGDVVSKDGKTEIHMSQATHRDLIGLLTMLERAGVRVASVLLMPDSENGSYNAITISVGVGT